MTLIAGIYSKRINHKQNYNRRYTQGIIIHYLVFYFINTQS